MGLPETRCDTNQKILTGNISLFVHVILQWEFIFVMGILKNQLKSLACFFFGCHWRILSFSESLWVLLHGLDLLPTT